MLSQSLGSEVMPSCLVLSFHELYVALNASPILRVVPGVRGGI